MVFKNQLRKCERQKASQQNPKNNLHVIRTWKTSLRKKNRLAHTATERTSSHLVYHCDLECAWL